MQHAVIMAGGFGGRLWPVSRRDTPKQFLKLIGDQTLIQQAYERINKVLPTEQIWVSTGEKYVELVHQQLPEIDKSQIIVEPAIRNTAPATALATLKVLQKDPKAVMFGILPADHYVGKTATFVKTTKEAFNFLEQNPTFVITIGIRPSGPTTAYGYIKVGQQLATQNNRSIFKVDSFHEKPDLKTAEQYLESGQYLWNGGYFLYNAVEMIKYYRQLAPNLLKQLEKYLLNPSRSGYEKLPKQPFDTAIVEKIKDLAVIPVEMNWSDVGDWAALHEILLSQGKKSQIVMNNHIGKSTENTLVMGAGKLIATVGLKDIVVIDTEDVILVCHKDSVQEVKKVVEKLDELGHHKYL